MNSCNHLTLPCYNKNMSEQSKTKLNKRRVVVIGGGPAGMMAAGHAAELGASVQLLERNNRLGWKLSITGKGRCNLTNAGDLDRFIEAFGSGGKFLYGPLHRFSPEDLMAFFNQLGLQTKIERGGRVFPVTDSALDVVKTLERWIRKAGVEVHFGSRVTRVTAQNKQITGVAAGEHFYPADIVVITTGGMSYKKTGSTGDGYRFAKDLGHTVNPPRPGLVPFEVADHDIRELQGLSLKNVEASVYLNGKIAGCEFGEMLFTHYGVSGPIVLTISRAVVESLGKGKVEFSINLKPALTEEQLDKRLIRDLSHRRALHNYLPELLPKKLIPVFIRRLKISDERITTQITAVERKRMLELLRDFRMTVTKTRPLEEAIVTAGGISLKEVDPRTMESKIVKGLYFAGEVLDISGVTGGFNLQSAFSTGRIAGEAALHRG